MEILICTLYFIRKKKKEKKVKDRCKWDSFYFLNSPYQITIHPIDGINKITPIFIKFKKMQKHFIFNPRNEQYC